MTVELDGYGSRGEAVLDLDKDFEHTCEYDEGRTCPEGTAE